MIMIILITYFYLNGVRGVNLLKKCVDLKTQITTPILAMLMLGLSGKQYLFLQTMLLSLKFNNPYSLCRNVVGALERFY